MNHSRKAQGLPISTIIIAALGLFVLVVIGAIFGGQIGKFGRASSECPGKCVKQTLPLDWQKVGAQFEENRPAGSENNCNPDTESRLSGSYIARGTPKGKEMDYACSACCVTI